MAEAAEMAKKLEVEMNETLQNMNQQAKSRARRAAIVLYRAALQVLRSKGSGRVYKIPGTYGKSKNTKKNLKDYGHKLRGGVLYRASAPGEVPANRLGNLRRNWRRYSLATPVVGGMKITARIVSDTKYASALNEGTKDGRIAPRPYADKIVETAMTKINQIYSEKFLN